MRLVLFIYLIQTYRMVTLAFRGGATIEAGEGSLASTFFKC